MSLKLHTGTKIAILFTNYSIRFLSRDGRSQLFDWLMVRVKIAWYPHTGYICTSGTSERLCAVSAFQIFLTNMMELESNTIEIIPPWTKYRLLHLSIARRLKLNEDDQHYFKQFFYESIPTASWDCSVVEQLMKMEQSRVICMKNLDTLIMFFDAIGESSEILQAIRTFKLRMTTIDLLTTGLPRGN